MEVGRAVAFEQTRVSSRRVPRERVLAWVGLGMIVLLAAVLRFMALDSLGYVNHYYAAAVKSMMQSWHNFFFVAAEPGGAVSVDKPPVGLWIQTISAWLLGFNTLGLLMPQLLAGLASVVLVYHLVNRRFGAVAGLLAALALAVTPVVVATDRNNTMDSVLILTLLLAAWAFIRATETARLRFLLLGGLLVGLAFNVKMLAAYLPLPAFLALYFLGVREGVWRKVAKLVLTGVVILVVSLSWAIAVDLTPPDQRPYVGSSGDNSVMSLIIGYNGVNRLLGMRFGRNLDGRVAPPQNVPFNRQGDGRQDGGMPRDGVSRGNPPGNRPGGQAPPVGPQGGAPAGAGRRPGGGFNLGEPGVFRLFVAPLSKEASWLLPLGLVGMMFLVVASRWTWPLGPEHQAVVLWGGWLVTCGVFFSVASFFHEYYLSILGAPIAALVGIGLARLWRMHRDRPGIATLLLVVLAVGTVAFQIFVARSFVDELPWLPLVVGGMVVGAVVLGWAGWRRRRGVAMVGFVLLVLAMYVTPAVWAYYTALYPGNNLSLPSAYSGEQARPASGGDIRVDPDLLRYLETNTQGIKYLMAVPSSMQGADYVLATGRPVLYMGGFNGNDEVVTANDLAEMVAEGELRYVYLGGNRGTQGAVASWVIGHCTPVSGFETVTRNFGPPDGMAVGGGAQLGGQGADFPVTLYDCAGG